MTLRFSQHIFHSDQFGYAKHARAFRTQIGLNKKKIMQTNLGTESTLPYILRESAGKFLKYAKVLNIFSIFKIVVAPLESS